MNISEIKDGMRRVDAEGEVTEVSDTRAVKMRDGGEARVADATLRDGTGEVSVSLWDDQIDKVAVGSRVRITNGYTRSYRGAMQLAAGTYGRLEVLAGGEEEGPDPLRCPACPFTNEGHRGWDYCPVDGSRLGEAP